MEALVLGLTWMGAGGIGSENTPARIPELNGEGFGGSPSNAISKMVPTGSGARDPGYRGSILLRYGQ